MQIIYDLLQTAILQKLGDHANFNLRMMLVGWMQG